MCVNSFDQPMTGPTPAWRPSFRNTATRSSLALEKSPNPYASRSAARPSVRRFLRVWSFSASRAHSTASTAAAQTCYDECMIRWRLDAGQIEVVDDAIAQILRRKTPAQRVAMILDANQTMRLLLEATVRTRHPEWTD